MAKDKSDKIIAGESFDGIELREDSSNVVVQLPEMNGSNSEPQEESKGGFDWNRAFRYKPNKLTASIIQTSCTDANLDRNDVISIALFLLQTATEDQLHEAFKVTFDSKASDLMLSLRGG